MLAVAVVLINPTLQMPAITKFHRRSGLVFAGPVFPFVCITIACGPFPVFTALASGSANAENDQARSRAFAGIGYGAMVAEMMVAFEWR